MDDRQELDWQRQAGTRRPVTIGAPDAHEPASSHKAWSGRSWLLLAMAIAALFTLEAALSSTALITPINRFFLDAMRGLGALVGLACGIIVAVSDREIGKFRKIVTVLFLPFMIGFLFDGLAWRMADWWEFGLSSAPFSPASYRIKSVDHGRKGSRDSIEIDPYATGEATHIPVPPEQYRALFGQASDYCVTVQQRTSASGAIEIRTDGEFTLQRPAPIALERCAAPAVNPWRLETPAR
ncbi:hypothetical protein KRR38_25010 [Novosphingobium sp. G106]|uniref:hypothetical protein n=1 Tax=Novosphingobium sp. G106 TaxID=2849500 RepID=UPI001C2DDA37|nr:hypothetical protein [Novosphingobium sp. G106]MBV1690849.1 hypothetical protein [Novosphingobium sp. G106]